MASIIIFVTLRGSALKEWRGTSRYEPRVHGHVGPLLLIGSTVIVG